MNDLLLKQALKEKRNDIRVLSRTVFQKRNAFFEKDAQKELASLPDCAEHGDWVDLEELKQRRQIGNFKKTPEVE